MQYTTLGRNGPKISRIGLGGLTFSTTRTRQWMFSEEDSRKVLRRAAELGVSFIDTADTYSDGESEDVIGRAWPEFWRREEVALATKMGGALPGKPRAGRQSRANVHDAVDLALRRLQTDYIDLFQLHVLDPLTPWEETLGALNEVAKAGKVRFIGVSNLLAFQLMKLLSISDAHGWARFVSVQNHYNLAYREEEREMAPLCKMEGVGMIPWSPLARGFLAGTVSRPGSSSTVRSGDDTRIAEFYSEPHDFAVLEQVKAVAARHGVKPAQVALAWLLTKPQLAAPIVGVTKISHLEDAVAAVDVRLDEADIRAMEAPYRPHPVYLWL